jgi:plasmid maintenance system antidote protein VapI
MAIRLSIVFSTSDKLWVDLQAGYDLWKAQQKKSKLHLKPLVLPKEAA